MPQLLADRALPARPGPVSRLDPGPGEGLVVEHAELGHARDSTLDELGLVAGATQSPAHLVHGARPRLQESRGRLEDHGRIVDGRAPLSLLGE